MEVDKDRDTKDQEKEERGGQCKQWQSEQRQEQGQGQSEQSEVAEQREAVESGPKLEPGEVAGQGQGARCPQAADETQPQLSSDFEGTQLLAGSDIPTTRPQWGTTSSTGEGKGICHPCGSSPVSTCSTPSVLWATSCPQVPCLDGSSHRVDHYSNRSPASPESGQASSQTSQLLGDGELARPDLCLSSKKCLSSQGTVSYTHLPLPTKRIV